jgi:hypothetical protein
MHRLIALLLCLLIAPSRALASYTSTVKLPPIAVLQSTVGVFDGTVTAVAPAGTSDGLYAEPLELVDVRVDACLGGQCPEGKQTQLKLRAGSHRVDQRVTGVLTQWSDNDPPTISLPTGAGGDPTGLASLASPPLSKEQQWAEYKRLVKVFVDLRQSKGAGLSLAIRAADVPARHGALVYASTTSDDDFSQWNVLLLLLCDVFPGASQWSKLTPEARDLWSSVLLRASKEGYNHAKAPATRFVVRKFLRRLAELGTAESLPWLKELRERRGPPSDQAKDERCEKLFAQVRSATPQTGSWNTAMTNLMGCFAVPDDRRPSTEWLGDSGGLYPWVNPSKRLMIDALSATDPALRVRACLHVSEMTRVVIEDCRVFAERRWETNFFVRALIKHAKQWADENPIGAE